MKTCLGLFFNIHLCLLFIYQGSHGPLTALAPATVGASRSLGTGIWRRLWRRGGDHQEEGQTISIQHHTPKCQMWVWSRLFPTFFRGLFLLMLLLLRKWCGICAGGTCFTFFITVEEKKRCCHRWKNRTWYSTRTSLEDAIHLDWSYLWGFSEPSISRVTVQCSVTQMFYSLRIPVSPGTFSLWHISAKINVIYPQPVLDLWPPSIAEGWCSKLSYFYFLVKILCHIHDLSHFSWKAVSL